MLIGFLFNFLVSKGKILAKKISKTLQALRFYNSFTTYFTRRRRVNGSTPLSTLICCTNIKFSYFLFNSVSALGIGALLENTCFSNFKFSYPFWQLPFGSPLLKATVLYTSPFEYHCVESSISDSIYLSA